MCSDCAPIKYLPAEVIAGYVAKLIKVHIFRK